LPYVGSVYFLPRPAIHVKSDEDDPKGAKHIEYLSWRRMEELLATADPPQARTEHLRQGRTVWIHPQDQMENSLLNAGEDPLWISGEETMIPRVTVDRVTSASALYFQGQVRFVDGCGFYCLARFCGNEANEFQKAVEQALMMLGEEGLGARRSAGLGRFELQGPEVVALRCPSEFDAHLLLSLYHPTKREVTEGVLEDARYHLILRKGWISSPDDASQRRMGIRMIREGALLPIAVTGDLTDVRPSGFPHAVYRSGLAFTVPCRRWVNA
jgi:CRISPR-associated protein Csm4